MVLEGKWRSLLEDLIEVGETVRKTNPADQPKKQMVPQKWMGLLESGVHKQKVALHQCRLVLADPAAGHAMLHVPSLFFCD